MRIYDLARQLGVTNKDILSKLPGMGVVVKSHASSLTPEQARAVTKIFRPDLLEAPPVVAPPPPAKPPRAETAPVLTPAPARKPGVVVTTPKPPAAAPKPAPGAPRRPAERSGRPPSRHGRPPRHEAKPEPPEKPEAKPVEAPPVKPSIVIREGLTVKELAEKLAQPPAKIIGMLMNLGVMASINQRIALDMAELVATEHGCEVKKEGLFKEKELAEASATTTAEARPRPPVVTIMGHVDHGKTLLLDTIRRTKVVEGEAGGMTQHIGAYTAEGPGGKSITFIDTPGHAAFTAMRARGAGVTDLVILVVAADDGLMPQTEEAIHHAQAANVPIIVAINKCDLPTASPDKVRQQLAEKNLVPEDWGGQTIMVEISAKTGKNIEKLMEMILLQAEMMELKAPRDCAARGAIVEAKLDRSRGAMATVLVKQGTLKVGDNFICGTTSGRVRALLSAEGKRLESVGPAGPAVVLGFEDLPQVGDNLRVIEDTREARYIAEERTALRREDTLLKQQKLTLEDIQKQFATGEMKELGLVVKADAAGSVEAIRDALERLPAGKVKLRLLHAAVGAINDTDVHLAVASRALVFGFNVRPIPSAETLARRQEVEIRFYDIIFKLIDDVQLAQQGLLEPIRKETVIGRAEVRQLFKVAKVGTVAGCLVKSGVMKRTAMARVIRDGKVVYTGKFGSLKRFKEDVKEVGVNFECGLGIENFNDLKVGDVIEAFTVTLEAASA